MFFMFLIFATRKFKLICVIIYLFWKVLYVRVKIIKEKFEQLEQ